MLRTLIATLLLALAISASANTLLAAHVSRVIDGDTIVVRLSDGSEERVRFIGVDTPELNRGHDPEPLALEATAYTQAHLLGRDITLELDLAPRDRFGRLLAHIWIDDQLFNLALIESGLALLMTIPPNVKYVEALSAAQQRAQAAQVGLWAAGVFAERCVDLNSASAEELERLHGIGPARAESIIAGRPWAALAELERIAGIGPATLRDLRQQGLTCQ